MCLQVAEYRKNKQELRKARREEEQAELDELQRKQDEEDVRFVNLLPALCDGILLCLALYHMSLSRPKVPMHIMQFVPYIL